MMMDKRDLRRTPPTTMKQTERKTDGRLDLLAARLRIAEGKNPYYKGEMAIRNLDELDRNLDAFDLHEAPWVADWLEYLGDAETAVRIRREPARFKGIVHERWAQLKNQL